MLHKISGQQASWLCKQLLQIGRGAAIAQSSRLRLPSCHPSFESQAHYLCFYRITFELCHVQKTYINKKRSGLGYFLKKQIIWKLNPSEILQQAVSSSAPSSQSETPSQSLLLSMHFGVSFGPPLGQLNLLSGHVMAVQLFSSVPSVQSLQPSQRHLAGIQRWFSQRNWPLWHGGKSEIKNIF